MRLPFPCRVFVCKRKSGAGLTGVLPLCLEAMPVAPKASDTVAGGLLEHKPLALASITGDCLALTGSIPELLECKGGSAPTAEDHQLI